MIRSGSLCHDEGMNAMQVIEELAAFIADHPQGRLPAPALDVNQRRIISR
jgi:hypothetical protein